MNLWMDFRTSQTLEEINSKKINEHVLRPFANVNTDVFSVIISFLEPTKLRDRDIGMYGLTYLIDFVEFPSCCFAAAHHGYFYIVQKLIEKFTNKNIISKCLIFACGGNHLEIAKFIINNGGIQYLSNGLKFACRHNNKEMIKMLIDEGERQNLKIDFSKGLYGACEKGHADVAREMLQRGIDDISICLHIACKYGHMEIIDLLLNELTPLKYKKYEIELKLDGGLRGACANGNLELVKLMIQMGANRQNTLLKIACRHGHVEIINYLINVLKIRDWNSGFIGACSGNKTEIAADMIRRGATRMNEGLYIACKRKYQYLINLIVVNGATRCKCGKSKSEHLK